MNICNTLLVSHCTLTPIRSLSVTVVCWSCLLSYDVLHFTPTEQEEYFRSSCSSRSTSALYSSNTISTRRNTMPSRYTATPESQTGDQEEHLNSAVSVNGIEGFMTSPTDSGVRLGELVYTVAAEKFSNK